MLKRTSGKNVALTTSVILDKLVTWSVATNYSWHGKKQKPALSKFVNITKLLLSK